MSKSTRETVLYMLGVIAGFSAATQKQEPLMWIPLLVAALLAIVMVLK